MLDFDFSVIEWVLWEATALCVIYIICVYCQRLRRIGKLKARCQDEIATTPVQMPSASIVIYARNESEALERNLPAILQQEYPGQFEVIVVNEGASEETSMVVGALRAAYPNLYLTYTPDGARNLSRKKLALTIGVKAAHGDVVLITGADVQVPSNQWLAQMMQPFADPDISIVTGCGQIATPNIKCLGRLTRAFDLSADEVAWINGALDGHPYRCCGFNLAYRRHIFFDNKGFSRSLNLREGVDDIFLSEIAEGRVAKVQLTDDTLVIREMMPYMRATRDLRVSHYFTGHKLSHSSKRLMALGEWCMWLTILLSVGAYWLCGWTNWAAMTLGACLIILSWIMVGISWHGALSALHTPHASIWLPFQAMLRPFRNILADIRSHLYPSHYTWTK